LVNHLMALGFKFQLHLMTEGFSVYNILKCIHDLRCIERLAESEELKDPLKG